MYFQKISVEKANLFINLDNTTVSYVLQNKTFCEVVAINGNNPKAKHLNKKPVQERCGQFWQASGRNK
jgi:hypothetical protein